MLFYSTYNIIIGRNHRHVFLGEAMLIVGTRIPPFSADAIADGKIVKISDKDLLGSYTLLFFYGLDFSYLCPGEVHSLQDSLKEFEERNTKVFAISVDSIYTHGKWLKTPRAKLGIAGTRFTLVSDMSQKLSRAFEVLDEEHGHSLRASFITDEENTIQYGSANSVAFGRSIKELLRVIDAIKSVKNGTLEFCPAV